MERNYRVPDVVVRYKDGVSKIHDTHWLGGPDFLIEVVSRGDRSRKKRPFYAKIGVREMMVVDRRPWAIELYRLADGELKLAGKSTLAESIEVASEVVPLGFRLVEEGGKPRIEVVHRADGRALGWSERHLPLTESGAGPIVSADCPRDSSVFSAGREVYGGTSAMIAKDCGRGSVRRILLAAAAFGTAGGPALVLAQAPAYAPALGQPAAPQQQGMPAQQKLRIPRNDQPRLVETAVPVNPTDPIALVNGEPITRAQLADECIVREGNKILETLIARKLIEQEIRKRKLDVTPAEVDREIEEVAMRLGGVNRETWLRTLDKERGISPAQYARDIIYPTIALRKLAAGRVQVTEQDMKDAFEANFGAKLHCRIITVGTQREAVQIWEELKANPAAFPNIAKTKSTDAATRALGGFLSEPIARHAHPRSVSDPAFAQLVDGDKKDKNPGPRPEGRRHDRPDPGQRHGLDPHQARGSSRRRRSTRRQARSATQLHAQLQDVKTKEAMTKVFEGLTDAADIDNRLTGTFKVANEKNRADVQQLKDRDVRLMGGPGADAKAPPRRRLGQPGERRPRRHPRRRRHPGRQAQPAAQARPGAQPPRAGAQP